MDLYQLLYKTGMPRLLRSILKPNALTILSLHQVSEEKSFFWSPVQPHVFEQLCAYVAKHYTVTTFAGLAEHPKPKKPLLILSFDDGYYDFVQYAMPALKKYNLPANHNIVYQCVNENMTIWTQRLNVIFEFLRNNHITDTRITFADGTTATLQQSGGDWRKWYNHVFYTLLRSPRREREPVILALEQQYAVQAGVRMMNWAEVQEVMKHHIEIGNHTLSHDVVATITDPEEMYREVVLSKQYFEEKLSIPIEVIALPNGETTAALSNSLGQAGYRYVLELNERTNPLRKRAADNLRYNRITIGGEPIEKLILRAETLQSTIQKIIK